MGVFFHILSTGGGAGASRITRYIAERDKDLAREGPGSRPLFSEANHDLSYRRADRILDPEQGLPGKADLIHFSITIQQDDFDKLGSNEKERQGRFREAIREAMKGIAEELNVKELTWVAGIHRNTEKPHAHIVISKHVLERSTGRLGRIVRVPKGFLPHKEIQNGKEVLVNGPLVDRFAAALEKQQALYAKSREEEPELTPAQRWEVVARKHQQGRERGEQFNRVDSERGQQRGRGTISLDHRQISASWNPSAGVAEDKYSDFRIALGKRLEFEFRLAFAEVWHDRAVNHGDTYRFEVVDQSTGDERKISDLDVRRRAAARASRVSQGDHTRHNEAISNDLSRHGETLQQLKEARTAKIDALGKDVASLRSNLAKVERSIAQFHKIPGEKGLTPLLPREKLSELQQQAVRLGLRDRVSELEILRMSLAREHNAPTRTDPDAATLAAQLNVARADFRAREARLENFEASVHLTTYEVGGDRWSLGALDKHIARRQEDSKLIPKRAARLDLRSLARLNYSAASREQAAADVERLTHIRNDIVRRIEERRAPLVADRELSRELLDILENAYAIEQRTRLRAGETMPGPKYERYQINSLEASAETLRDPKLLGEVHQWEKDAPRTDSKINWEGRAVAREVMSGLAVDETKERLKHFLESERVVSLHLGNQQTGTLREVEARNLTEYLTRAILESREQRDHRHTVKAAARDYHGRLIKDFEKASDYHQAARQFASEVNGRDPQFTDKERMNLEIHAERLDDAAERERYLDLARNNSQNHEREEGSARER